MDDFEKERREVRACRLSEVTNEEFSSALEFYKEAAGRMWLIPDYFFDIGVVAGIGVAMFFSQFWIRLFGIVICLFGASHVGKRMGSFNGFRDGYVRGKQSGARRALGIAEGDVTGLMKKAEELIKVRCE